MEKIPPEVWSKIMDYANDNMKLQQQILSQKADMLDLTNKYYKHYTKDLCSCEDCSINSKSGFITKFKKRKYK